MYIYIYVCVCVCMNVKFSSTRPTSRVNFLSLECEQLIYAYEGDSEGDKMSKFRVWVLRDIKEFFFINIP